MKLEKKENKKIRKERREKYNEGKRKRKSGELDARVIDVKRMCEICVCVILQLLC